MDGNALNLKQLDGVKHCDPTTGRPGRWVLLFWDE
jgi:hypothetical protein